MKYFVVTDVHGYFTEMKYALDEAGYDPSNPNHFFISCGDVFDRGTEPDKILFYLNSLPSDRRAFVQGNHESILIEFLRGSRRWSYADVRNGTMDTILQLTGVPTYYKFDDALRILSKDEELHNYLDSLVDYYETANHIFVHGWIPKRYNPDMTYSYNDWRNATHEEWEIARRECGFAMWEDMHFMEKTGETEREEKTIVCGHWHTSYAHVRYHNLGIEFPVGNAGIEKCHFEPFIDDRIVGLDACTALTHKINVLVIEE